MTVDGSYNNGQFALNVICSSGSKSDLSVKQQRTFGWYFPNRFPKQRTAYHFRGIVHYEQIPSEISQGYTFQIFYAVISVVHRQCKPFCFLIITLDSTYLKKRQGAFWKGKYHSYWVE